jgi:hypothetical protein
MPARERQKFVLAVLHLEDAQTRTRHSRIKQVKWPNVEARARRIFGDRHFPNLVLMEREEEAR